MAASLRRLLIERQHQVQNLARLWSAIDEIAKLKKGGITARPVALLVDEPYALQNGAEVIEISVDIADSDQQWCRARRGGCRAGRQSQQQHNYPIHILKDASEEAKQFHRCVPAGCRATFCVGCVKPIAGRPVSAHLRLVSG